jgi:hypothetical protein
LVRAAQVQLQTTLLVQAVTIRHLLGRLLQTLVVMAAELLRKARQVDLAAVVVLLLLQDKLQLKETSAH